MVTATANWTWVYFTEVRITERALHTLILGEKVRGIFHMKLHWGEFVNK